MATPTLGFGRAGFGSSRFGFGTPATSSARAGTVLRDPSTGLQANARMLDGATKQPLFDANGRALGMSGVRQRVQLALSTEKGSSSIVALGHELRAIKRISSDLQRRARDTVAQALAHMTSGVPAEIALVNVIAKHVRGGLVTVVVKWRDLSSGQVFDTEIT